MTTSIDRFVRPSVINLAPYIAGKPTQDVLRLHANESSLTPNTSRRDDQAAINRYTGILDDVINRVTKAFNISNDEFQITRGSSEGVDIILRTFCQPNEDNIIISSPTFDMYRFYANILDINVIDSPLLQEEKVFKLDIASIKKNIFEHDKVKVLFLCSPNNPTGQLIKTNDIIDLCDAMSDQGIVVVDEAYIEFSKQRSMTARINEINNLVILRTMSKAYGIAAARVGFIISNKDVMNYTQRVTPPYTCPINSQEIILEALEPNNINQSNAYVENIKSTRELLANALREIKCIDQVFCSDANFVLCQTKTPEEVVSSLREKGVLIRSFPNIPSLRSFIRITMGSDAENEQMLNALKLFKG